MEWSGESGASCLLAGVAAPTAREAVSLAAVKSYRLYFAGGPAPPGTYTVEAYTLSLGDLVSTCDASAAPTNGLVGTCTSSVAAGSSCTPSCNSGYALLTETSCSSTGVLTPGTCLIPEWVSKNSMPTPRYHLAVATAGNLVYTLGGYPYVTTLEVYTPTTDSWATKTPMPDGRSLMSFAPIGNRLYVAGGGWPASAVNMQVYNLAADQWTSRSPLPDYTTQYKYGWDVYGGRMHVVGGYDDHPLIPTRDSRYSPPFPPLSMIL